MKTTDDYVDDIEDVFAEEGECQHKQYHEEDGIYDQAEYSLTQRGRVLLGKIVKQITCKHTKTVCINEEGNAGVLCAYCGKQLDKEC